MNNNANIGGSGINNVSTNKLPDRKKVIQNNNVNSGSGFNPNQVFNTNSDTNTNNMIQNNLN